jgi:hypothetical protein
MGHPTPGLVNNEQVAVRGENIGRFIFVGLNGSGHHPSDNQVCRTNA